MSERPEWWEPGLSVAEIASWEAAERTVAEAPLLRPGDDTYERLRPLVGGTFAAPAREERGAA